MDPNDALRKVHEIVASALTAIHGAGHEDLEKLKVTLLGRKSTLAGIGRALGAFPADDRKSVGQASNEARETLLAALTAREAAVRATTPDELIDLTLPGRSRKPGKLHPLTQTLEDVVDVFTGLGFSTVEGPIVETDYYNFEALNIPKDHAARSMHDTLYVESGDDRTLLVRTHTSPMQVRYMETHEPPIYVIVPGMVGRNEEIGPNNLAIFYQVEGLAVDEGITFGDMKGTLDRFARAMFGDKFTVRLQPSFFPFTEPSAEVYVSCFLCDGSGCVACKREGWIEIMGAGMVHPEVLRKAGYDSERHTGFAFGMGIERIAKLRFRVPDLRMFYENDLVFLGRGQ